jgi:ComF family protein
MLEKLTNQDWFQGLVDFVFPPLCLGCGAFHEESNQICSKCIEALEEFEHPLCLNCRAFVSGGGQCPVCLSDSLLLFAFADYKPPLIEIIHQFKFKGITSPAETFAGRIHEKFGKSLAALRCEALVPIPLFSWRQSRRGYNQAELIALQLAKKMNLPVNSNILSRIKRGSEQARLEFKRRATNVRNAFSGDSSVGLRRVILVDDVVTTGATVLEASRTLQGVGCRTVGVVSIAHGI